MDVHIDRSSEQDAKGSWSPLNYILWEKVIFGVHPRIKAKCGCVPFIIDYTRDRAISVNTSVHLV